MRCYCSSLSRGRQPARGSRSSLRPFAAFFPQAVPADPASPRQGTAAPRASKLECAQGHIEPGLARQLVSRSFIDATD